MGHEQIYYKYIKTIIFKKQKTNKKEMKDIDLYNV